MAKTYELSDANSDLSIGGSFTDTLTTSPSGTNAILAASGGGVASGYYAADANDPSSSGTSTGTFTAVLNVSSASGSTQARCYLLRLNSSGVTQTEVVSPTGYVSTATTGDKTWTWTDPALGTWAAGDRIALRVEVQNNNAHGGSVGPTFDHTSANTRLDTPFVLTHFGAVVFPITLDRLAAGKLTAKSVAVSPFTFGLVTNGVRTRFGAIVLPLTLDHLTNGVTTRFGSTDFPIVFGIFVDGTASGGGGPTTHFGSVVLPLTLDISTNGVRGTFSAVQFALALDLLANGKLGARSSASTPLTLDTQTIGRLGAVSGVSLPLALSILTDGFTGELGTPTTRDYTTLSGTSGELVLSAGTGRTLSAEP